MNYCYTLLMVVMMLGCTPAKKPREIKEVSLSSTGDQGRWPLRLSEWQLFDEPMHRLNPLDNVFSYEINSALFSDYTFKARYIKLPVDSVMKYEASSTFQFPVGTVLVKNFFYPTDFKKPEGKRRILETRLLVLEPNGWNALPYIWNDQQTEAQLEVAGDLIEVTWNDIQGKQVSLDYSVPNQVQCKSCHERNGSFSPIGPSARQLNLNNQLQQWAGSGILLGLPEADIPRLANYNNEAETLNDRARAWLEINCAHCHSEEGPAKNTGLHLWASETNPYKIGIGKPPVAAGRGSGGLKHSIVPGNPDESILYYRIKSVDPGVMMPELGRKMEHKEGVELIKKWIKQLNSS